MADLQRSTDQVLSVRDANVWFGSRGGDLHAVRGVDLAVHRGERIGIVGESGSGKSTLALSILGLIEPPGRVTGEVWLHGRRIDGSSDRAFSRVRGGPVGMVFQDPLSGLNPVRRIGTQLIETMRMHTDGLSRRQAAARAVELLGDVDIPHPRQRLRAYPHELSGGMRQRVMIAMALANDPDLLIADEPTTALDVTTQAHILALLNRVTERRGTAILLITHNVDLVKDFCDTILVMYGGRLVEHGPASDVLARAAHPYTAALRSAVPTIDVDPSAPLRTLPGLPPDLRTATLGCSLEPRCPLGRGDPTCQTTTPRPVGIDVDGGRRIVECHHVDRQLEERL